MHVCERIILTMAMRWSFSSFSLASYPLVASIDRISQATILLVTLHYFIFVLIFHFLHNQSDLYFNGQNTLIVLFCFAPMLFPYVTVSMRYFCVFILTSISLTLSFPKQSFHSFTLSFFTQRHCYLCNKFTNVFHSEHVNGLCCMSAAVASRFLDYFNYLSSFTLFITTQGTANTRSSTK